MGQMEIDAVFCVVSQVLLPDEISVPVVVPVIVAVVMVAEGTNVADVRPPIVDIRTENTLTNDTPGILRHRVVRCAVGESLVVVVPLAHRPRGGHISTVEAGYGRSVQLQHAPDVLLQYVRIRAGITDGEELERLRACGIQNRNGRTQQQEQL
jgi:hypothetical protein